VRARRRFAQHFLEPAWVRKVAACVNPAPTDAILEVGPGRGALTRALAAAGPTMTAIELDRDLAAELAPTLPPHVRLVTGDVLAVDLEAEARALLAHRTERLGAAAASLPSLVRVAGNLPYNISTPLIARLVTLARDTGLVSDLTVMVQREVAERLCGRPGTGDFGPLSILAQTWADVAMALHLPAGAFRPPPKVASAVVTFTFRPARVDVGDVAQFDRVVRSAFLHRRKTVANALQSVAHAHGTTMAALLAAADLDGRRRPETLEIDEFARLARLLADLGRAAS
jgi:16S rRNA (adenine1518-N6/adenine1519-N6)-dimethyltransferase